MECLTDLEQRGLIRLPSRRGKSWDGALGVPVPRFIDLVRDDAPARERDWRTFPWHPQIQWAADLTQPSDRQIAFLRQVHEGLVKGDFARPAPLKYRSLQLTGDEKGLAQLMRTQLFAPGRLSLDRLGCLPEVLPLPWESVGSGTAIIIFENAGPFSVARSVLQQMAEPPYGMVGYGCGGGLESAVQHLTTIGRPVETIHYVGDLDVPGLRIAYAAQQKTRDLGLPVLTAAPGLHRAMLAASRDFGHPRGWLVEPTKTQRRRALPEDTYSFLPSGVRSAAREIIQGGHRVPEEVLGPTELAAAWSERTH